MKKLFVDFVPVGTFKLNQEQSRHIAGSLRMKKGDMVTLCCQDGDDYGCIIEGVNKGEVTLSVCYKQASGSEPTVFVTLYQGVAKGDKLEEVMQKCTELGVSAVCPVLTKRSISRPDEKSAAKKRERYGKIALEAAQQSGRGIVPRIMQMTSLENAVKNDDSELKIIFYEGGGERLKSIIKGDEKSVSIYIGPEGGFDALEVKLLEENGAVVAGLGARILRTETAPVAALTAIMLLSDNM